MTLPSVPTRAQFAVWLLPPLLFLCSLAVYLAIPHRRMAIVAAVEGCDQHPCQMTVTGRINTSDDMPLDGAKVWVEARTSQGDRIVRFGTADKAGTFVIADIPGENHRRNVVWLTVGVSNKGQTATLKVLDESLLSIPVIFILITLFFGTNLFLAFHRGEPGPLRYRAALAFACIFTGVMIVGLALGLRHASTTGAKDPIALPFGSVVWGSFDKNTEPEWLLLLTSPDSASAPAGARPGPQSAVPANTTVALPAQAPVSEHGKAADTSTTPGQTPPAVSEAAAETEIKGFGAPLWVLLMSVLGCSILTVSLIVGEIGNPPKSDEIRARIQKVVRHQYFIMFSPVGAVFVYQLLLVANAAANNLTVALAALGSGVTINSLLNVAIRNSKALLEESGRGLATGARTGPDAAD